MLIGEQAILRPVQAEDLTFLCDWLNTPRLRGSWQGTRLRSPRELEKNYDEDGLLGPDRGTLVLGTFDLDSVGLAHWWAAGPGGEVLEASLWVARAELRGQGLGSRALRLLIHYLFATWPVERIQGVSPPGHAAARGAARAAGMTEEGILRHMAFLNGRFEDQVMMAILRAEWEANPRYEELRRLFLDPPDPPSLKPVGFRG